MRFAKDGDGWNKEQDSDDRPHEDKEPDRMYLKHALHHCVLKNKNDHAQFNCYDALN